MSSAATAVTAAAISIAVLMVLFAIIRSRRDKTVRTTRWGFFIERDRYGDGWEDDQEQPTQTLWPSKEESK